MFGQFHDLFPHCRGKSVPFVNKDSTVFLRSDGHEVDTCVVEIDTLEKLIQAFQLRSLRTDMDDAHAVPLCQVHGDIVEEESLTCAGITGEASHLDITVFIQIFLLGIFQITCDTGSDITLLESKKIIASEESVGIR
ncbi:MAG: hypothetical protein BWY61_02039 [Firmicutes bacterium ADurb.Bin354]|nr:MAG: hypothetical protein BWY61_02039 [Firmicutes bacterium ADurb.Bin354]